MAKQDSIVEQAYEVFERAQFKAGLPPPDQVSFIGGYMTLFGILTGRVPCPGVDPDAPLDKIFDAIHADILGLASRLIPMAQADNIKRNGK